MGHAAVPSPMTADEFLAWDTTQTIKHEFVRGRVVALSGAHEAHVTLVGNVYSALRQPLKGSPCRTLATDMKLRVEAADAFYYPDVMVTCSAADAADPLVKREPTLVVEVLSPRRPTTAERSSTPTGCCRRCRNTCWSTRRHAAATSTAAAPTDCGCCTRARRNRACTSRRWA